MTKAQRRGAISAELVRLISEERTRRGVSKNELAARCGLNQSTMSRFENHAQNPTLDSLIRISEALELDLGDLVSRAVRNVNEAGMTK